MSTFPSAKKEGIIVQESSDETLIFDSQEGKAFCLNPTASAILKHCNGSNTISEIALLLGQETKEKVNDGFVELGVQELGRKGLLVGEFAAKSISRRDLIKKIGLTAGMLAIPVVMSLVVTNKVSAVFCDSTAPCPLGQSCTGGTPGSMTCV